MPELSVVIPIYKVENYLKRCVNSVLTQDYDDIEVILVDDGSPDGCPEICDEFAAIDKRVKVVHKKNGGLSSARNAGIMTASGNYITFLDSDDMWLPNSLAAIMKVLTNQSPEMLMFMSYDMTHDGKMYERRDMKRFFERGVKQEYKIREYYELLISEGNLHESACTKILSSNFLKKNALMFQEGIISEDTEWMFRVLRCCSHIVVTNLPMFVCTIDREGSISNSANAKSLDGILKIIEQSVQYCGNHSSRIGELELSHCAYLLAISYGIYREIEKKDRIKYREQLIRYSNLFQYNNGQKVSMVKKIYNVFGFDLSTCILNLYIKLNKKIKIGRKQNDEQEIKSSSFGC